MSTCKAEYDSRWSGCSSVMLGTESRRVTDLFDFLWRNRPDRMPAGTRADSTKQDKELIRSLMVE